MITHTDNPTCTSGNCPAQAVPRHLSVNLQFRSLLRLSTWPGSSDEVNAGAECHEVAAAHWLLPSKMSIDTFVVH